MKRYRVLQFDYDARANLLKLHFERSPNESDNRQHEENIRNVENGLIAQYGSLNFEQKKKNFIDLGIKFISVVAFHNRFFEQIRSSFVIGSYYPSLTGACALGERILNHLILTLRDFYKHTPEYKNIYKKRSFDDWPVVIGCLEAWKILLPNAVTKFKELLKIRNDSIHFRPEVENNDRDLALKAILCLDEIIHIQFGGFGSHPWFIKDVGGEIYIKKDWEKSPFIHHVYLPNCLYVGPNHKVLDSFRLKVEDIEYESLNITDEEFSRLRNLNNLKV